LYLSWRHSVVGGACRRSARRGGGSAGSPISRRPRGSSAPIPH